MTMVEKKEKKIAVSKTIPQVDITIPALSEYVGVARLAISGIASRLEFTVEQVEDIKVAISEACSNAVQYAYGKNGADHTIHINCTVQKKFLEVTITDTGCGFDPDNPPEPEKDDGHTHLGLGITFMKTLMDNVAITSQKNKGTTVRLTKKISK